MANQLHPLQTTDLIRNSYIRYLKTIYPFQDSYLRDQFWQALQQPELIIKGPLLEASPPFKTGRSIADLVQAGILHPAFRQLCSAALPWERPLYLHQDQAITKNVQGGRNLVVATGTGSGKTETFVIPILDYLLRERAAGALGPGVRALLLYPMNALANDQLKRLRRILEHFPDFTFGRYTGETKERYIDAEKSFYEQFRGEPRLPNELICRDEMRASPPHILLTNYAMLEYLLLRPEDNTFFDGELAQHWRFITLDEAHVYDGAAGIEIAMLVRRLKDRVVGSEPDRLRCMATSATLGRGPADYPKVVTFASELFGEPFTWVDTDPQQQDVVEATRLPASAWGEVWGQGQPALYTALQRVLEADRPTVAALLKAATDHGIPPTVITVAGKEATVSGRGDSETLNRCLYFLLYGDERLHQLQGYLTEQPHFMTQLAERLFPDEPDATEALIRLVNVAVRARPTPEAVSLLPARYHVFARALEGAFACLNPGSRHRPRQEQLFLNRRDTCPHCESKVFELATCTRCGVAYIAGRIVRELGDKDRRFLRQLSNQPDDAHGRRAYFLLGKPQIGVDEDEAVAAEENIDSASADEQDVYTLCLKCGAIEVGVRMNTDCGCSKEFQRQVYHIELNGKPELSYCVSCGARRPGGVVFRFLTGQDAPVSVLATSLYQTLPPAVDEAMEGLPGHGRKLLSFADSRQDAAFFAPYLERTYVQFLRRRLILKALLNSSAGRQGTLRLQDMVKSLLVEAEAAGQFTQAQSYNERQVLMSTWLMQELIAIDRRISLEGLGLMHFRLVKPSGWSPPPQLLDAPWNLSASEAWSLLELLLNTLRQQGAVTFMDQVDPRDEFFAPRNRPLYLRSDRADPKKGIFSWSPSAGSNRRLDILTKILAEVANLSESERKRQAASTLEGLWKHLTTPGSVWSEHLPAENLGKDGIVHRLSHLFWEFVPVTESNTPAYVCSRCRSISYINLHGLCPEYRCDGHLEPVNFNDPGLAHNHYRYLYQNLLPIPFSAREHTAQWTSTEATLVQQQFVRGELNALSCSTTFELGVDVGELQAVLMRNVPPTTANYVQRAGRAGRRTDSAALALTYAQRRSHDLAYFNHPVRMVSGTIRPPAVVVANEKIVRRHIHSVLLAAFFRWAKTTQQIDFRNVGSFFAQIDGKQTGPELLRQYLATKPGDILSALRRIVPADMQSEFSLDDWGWLSKLMNDEETGILDLAAREVASDLEEFARMEQDVLAEGGKNKYKLAQYFQQVANTIKDRHLLGFLGSRNVLPKYGFPTDVVELRTSHLPIPEAKQVELQRDLKIAISEYAPGGQVVAAGKVWTSGGIHRQPNREWPIHYYAVCPQCSHFHHSQEHPIQGPCSACGADLQGRGKLGGKFIIPEFGFIVAEQPKDTGEHRPDRFYSTQVFFSNYEKPKDSAGANDEQAEQVDELISYSQLQLWKRYSRYGKLALVNAGPLDRGYIVCQWCGHAEPTPLIQPGVKGKPPKAHKHPRTGKDCKGFTQTFHLGHEFITDVLELRFAGAAVNNPNLSLWRSVLYALLDGASEALGIRRDDLDGTLWRRYNSGPIPSIILFDSVPGGAGHVRRIADELLPAFRAAYERVAECECGEETSCYECLRNYRNQYFHDQLQRGLARDFLQQVLQVAGA